MSAQNAPSPYAATCNPPRRAKRQRTGILGGDSLPTPPASSSPPSTRHRPAGRIQPSLAKQPPADSEYALRTMPEPSTGSDEDDKDYVPGREVTPTPKRRGRKPGTMSRSARESLRKLNHSRIEKTRRTKINEMLATLSNLVGDRERVLPSHSGSLEVSGLPAEEEGGGKKGKGTTEKEFKLDVLVKTVDYMKDLIAHAEALESTLCSHCRTRDGAVEVPLSLKRRRPEENVGEAQHSTSRMRISHEEVERQPEPLANTSSRASTSPLLPPISSWLPLPYVDPSSIIATYPNTTPVWPPPHAQALATPPSGHVRPLISPLANMRSHFRDSR
ncbi:hypothetical protein C8Q80DRAFT_1267743 [Daedaleopsis nitida]|nr:hypothetical protein C8Q80DRAFT_1267743 [Daedaleopsis nitida]